MGEVEDKDQEREEGMEKVVKGWIFWKINSIYRSWKIGQLNELY